MSPAQWVTVEIIYDIAYGLSLGLYLKGPPGFPGVWRAGAMVVSVARETRRGNGLTVAFTATLTQGIP